MIETYKKWREKRTATKAWRKLSQEMVFFPLTNLTTDPKVERAIGVLATRPPFSLELDDPKLETLKQNGDLSVATRMAIDASGIFDALEPHFTNRNQAAIIGAHTALLVGLKREYSTEQRQRILQETREANADNAFTIIVNPTVRIG